MVDDNLQKKQFAAIISDTLETAKDCADNTQSIILSQGNDPGEMDVIPKNRKLAQ